MPLVPVLFYAAGVTEPQPPPVSAVDVCRGVSRLLLARDAIAMSEVPLGNGRRADLMALDAGGCVTIVEIKISRADLLGDHKWSEYLDFCDRFFWAVPSGFDTGPLESAFFLPERTGVIVADRYAGVITREARLCSVAPARRKAETLRFARRAASRLLRGIDPDCDWPESG